MKLPVTFAAFAALAAAQSPLVEGQAGSRVRVVIYEDLQCPDCAAFRKMMDDHLLGKYGDRVAFQHRDFPIPRHTWARKAAVAARYFAEVKPETGIAFRRYVLANIKAIPDAEFDAKLRAFAARHGADAEKAVAALGDARLAAQVEKDFQDGVARGVAKTPTVYVNGKPFIETFTLEEISKAIEEALAETR